MRDISSVDRVKAVLAEKEDARAKRLAARKPGGREQYPAAPRDPAERAAWMNARNAAIQKGVRPVDGVTFGSGKVPKS